MLAARRPAGPEGRPDVAGTKSSPTDVVTEMDRAAEAMIADRILAERPGDAILGEEGGESGHGRVRWIVDPLDGTINYVYGLADWAVSIAAEVDGAVVAGVVAVPRHREVFTAVAGQGSWLHPDGAPAVRLQCNAGVPLDKALVSTGFGYARARRVVQGEIVAAVLPQVRDIRRAVPARWICARSPPAGSMPTTSGRQLLGLRRRVASSRPRRGPGWPGWRPAAEP